MPERRVRLTATNSVVPERGGQKEPGNIKAHEFDGNDIEQ